MHVDVCVCVLDGLMPHSLNLLITILQDLNDGFSGAQPFFPNRLDFLISY